MGSICQWRGKPHILINSKPFCIFRAMGTTLKPGKRALFPGSMLWRSCPQPPLEHVSSWRRGQWDQGDLPVRTLCPALLIFAPSIWSPEFPAPLALHPHPGLHEPHPWAVLPRESHASWSHSWALSKSEQGADVCRGEDRAQMQGSGCPRGECKALYCAGWSQLSNIRGQDRRCCHLSPCHWA